MKRLTEMQQRLHAVNQHLALLQEVLSEAHESTEPVHSAPQMVPATSVPHAARISVGVPWYSLGFRLGTVCAAMASLGAVVFSVGEVRAWSSGGAASSQAQVGAWSTSLTTPALCTTHNLGPFTPANTVTGTSGNDTLNLGNQGQLAIALAGHDTVLGGNGKDCIDGGDGNDSLKGGNGKDVILGGSGDDTLFGGNGKDVLDGGPGFDICVGGNGQDTIINCEIVFQDDDLGGNCDERSSQSLIAEDAGGAGGSGGGGQSGNDDDCDDNECGRDRQSLTGGAGGGGKDDDDDCDDHGHRSAAGPADAGADSSKVAVETATPGAAPAPPSGLAASVEGNSVKLTWKPVGGVAYYNIYRSDTQGSGWEGVGSSNVPSFVDTEVVVGHTYYYVVTAVGPSKGQSRESNEAAAKLAAATATPPPTATQSATATATATATVTPTAKH